MTLNRFYRTLLGARYRSQLGVFGYTPSDLVYVYGDTGAPSFTRWLWMVDVARGTNVWAKNITASVSTLLFATSRIMFVDSNGDLLIGGHSAAHHTIYRLSQTDGSLLQTFADSTTSGNRVVSESVGGRVWNGRRYMAADGSTLWTRTPIGGEVATIAGTIFPNENPVWAGQATVSGTPAAVVEQYDKDTGAVVTSATVSYAGETINQIEATPRTNGTMILAIRTQPEGDTSMTAYRHRFVKVSGSTVTVLSNTFMGTDGSVPRAIDSRVAADSFYYGGPTAGAIRPFIATLYDGSPVYVPTSFTFAVQGSNTNIYFGASGNTPLSTPWPYNVVRTTSDLPPSGGSPNYVVTNGNALVGIGVNVRGIAAP